MRQDSERIPHCVAIVAHASKLLQRLRFMFYEGRGWGVGGGTVLMRVIGVCFGGVAAVVHRFIERQRVLGPFRSLLHFARRLHRADCHHWQLAIAIRLPFLSGLSGMI